MYTILCIVVCYPYPFSAYSFVVFVSFRFVELVKVETWYKVFVDIEKSFCSRNSDNRKKWQKKKEIQRKEICNSSGIFTREWQLAIVIVFLVKRFPFFYISMKLQKSIQKITISQRNFEIHHFSFSKVLPFKISITFLFVDSKRKILSKFMDCEWSATFTEFYFRLQWKAMTIMNPLWFGMIFSNYMVSS